MQHSDLEALRQQLAAEVVPNPGELLAQAMQQGQAGLELVVEALYHSAIPVQMAAYELLHDRSEPDIRWKRLWYSPYMAVQKKFDNFQSSDQMGKYTQFAFTPDSQKLVVVDYYGNLHLWDIKTAALIHTLPGDSSYGHKPGWGYSKTLGAIAAQPQGQTVWIGTRDGLLQERDWMTGRIQRTLQGKVRCINSLALDATGRYLLTGSDPSYGAELWDLATGEVMLHLEETYQMHEKTTIAIAPDASLLATGSWKNQVKLWDRQGNLRHTIPGRSFDFVPHSSTIVTHDINPVRIQVWDAQTGECLREFEEPEAIRDLKVTPDGRAVVLRGNGTLQIRSLATGELLNRVRTSHSGRENGEKVAMSPDQTKLATGEIEVFTVRRTIILGSEIPPADQLTHLQNLFSWRSEYDPRFRLTCYTEEALIRDYCRMATEWGLTIRVEDLRQRVQRVERMGFSEPNYYQYFLSYNKPRTLPLNELNLNRSDIDAKQPAPVAYNMAAFEGVPYNNTEYCP